MDGAQPMIDDKSNFAADPQVAAEEVCRPTVEQRDFRRRQIYVADGAKVEITTRHGLAYGYVIDLDPRGLRIALAKGAASVVSPVGLGGGRRLEVPRVGRCFSAFSYSVEGL